MDQLVAITREEVRKYAGDGAGLDVCLYPILDDKRYSYSVIAIEIERDHEFAEGIVVFARLVQEHIIIEVDNTDKPLVDALVQRGIPRTQIVLAYAGETLTEIVS